MGMYDTVMCTRTMPDGFQTSAEDQYQTKDLDCAMDFYRITEDGRLILWKNVWDRATELNKETNFHGWLNFYTHDAEKKWHEYNAKFTDGRLVEIVVVPE